VRRSATATLAAGTLVLQVAVLLVALVASSAIKHVLVWLVVPLVLWWGISWLISVLSHRAHIRYANALLPELLERNQELVRASEELKVFLELEHQLHTRAQCQQGERAPTDVPEWPVIMSELRDCRVIVQEKTRKIEMILGHSVGRLVLSSGDKAAFQIDIAPSWKRSRPRASDRALMLYVGLGLSGVFELGAYNVIQWATGHAWLFNPGLSAVIAFVSFGLSATWFLAIRKALIR
jgi:hypothetical protein